MSDTPCDVHGVGKSSGRARAYEMWQRMLEQEAQQSLVGQNPSQLDAATPVAGPGEDTKAEQRSDSKSVKLHFADKYERGLATNSHAIKQDDAVQLDAENDGEVRAGRHLRLQQIANPQQPTQNLMATLASQRKSVVRTQRQVQKKGSSNQSGFGHLPHAGVWNAKALPEVSKPVRSRTRAFVPQTPKQIAFT